MTKLLEDRKHGISSALEPWIAKMVVLVVVIMVTGDTVFFPGLEKVVNGRYCVWLMYNLYVYIYIHIFFHDL